MYVDHAGCRLVAYFAYGLGINGLYLNLKGREKRRHRRTGAHAGRIIAELKERLEAVTDLNGQP